MVDKDHATEPADKGKSTKDQHTEKPSKFLEAAGRIARGPYHQGVLRRLAQRDADDKGPSPDRSES